MIQIDDDNEKRRKSKPKLTSKAKMKQNRRRFIRSELVRKE
jgi:hypothetical protein